MEMKNKIALFAFSIERARSGFFKFAIPRAGNLTHRCKPLTGMAFGSGA
jgi:hypothetical protein